MESDDESSRQAIKAVIEVVREPLRLNGWVTVVRVADRILLDSVSKQQDFGPVLRHVIAVVAARVSYVDNLVKDVAAGMSRSLLKIVKRSLRFKTYAASAI